MNRSRTFRGVAFFLAFSFCLNLFQPLAYARDYFEAGKFVKDSVEMGLLSSDSDYADSILTPLNSPTDSSGNVAGESSFMGPFNRSSIELNDETILDELKDKREIGAKHFLLSDGSRAAVVYGYAIHEEDATGKLVDIDNTLRRTEKDTYDYVTSHNGSPQPNYKGGRFFANDARADSELLPTQYGPFREYDIYPMDPIYGRTSERIVIGQNGTAWYTGDHYKSFIKMEK